MREHLQYYRIDYLPILANLEKKDPTLLNSRSINTSIPTSGNVNFNYTQSQALARLSDISAT